MVDHNTELRGLRNLLQKRDPKEPVNLVIGEVYASPGGGVLSIKIEGAGAASPNIHYLASYTPVVGDVVFLLKSGPDYLCLGDLA